MTDIELLATELESAEEVIDKLSAKITQLGRENAELRKQLQSEHERQARVWSVIQSQHREYTPLSMQKEQS
jgi:chromosome segregation ATPase